MRHPQLLVVDSRGGLGELLRSLAQERRWFFRERRQPESILRFLRRGNPSVLVLRLGGNLLGRALEREFRLFERVGWQFPDTGVVVVCEPECAGVCGLAWELGAGYILPAGMARELLAGVVSGLMKSALQAVQLPGMQL